MKTKSVFIEYTGGKNQPRFAQAEQHGLARLIPFSGSKFPKSDLSLRR